MMLLTALVVCAFAPVVFPLAAARAETPAPGPKPPVEPAIAFGARRDDPQDGLPEWIGSINVGATWTGGNSKTTSLSSTFDAQRKTEQDRWTTSLFWNFGAQDSSTGGVGSNTVVTQREYGGRLQYDRFVNERLYWLGNVGATRDDIAGLQLRATAGAGVGYQFKDEEKLSLNGEAGLNGVHEDNVGNGIPLLDPGPNEYLSLRLAYNAGYQLSETTRFDQFTEFFPSLKDSSDFTSRIDTRMDVNLTEAMFLRLQHVFEFDNTPAAGSGSTDNKVILTLGWSF